MTSTIYRLKIEPGDLELLKEGTVDFYTFSYYMTNCVTTHTDAAKTDGNLSGGFKKPLPGGFRLGAGRSTPRACAIP